MNKRHLVGTTAALLGAVLMVDILQPQAVAAGGSIGGGLPFVAGELWQGSKGDGQFGPAPPVTPLLADISLWADLPLPEGRPVWDMVGVGMATSDAFARIDGDSHGYPLAGPINAAQGGDALAAALRQPVNFSTVPEPGNWLSMILGLALVGYTLRRPQRVPMVSS